MFHITSAGLHSAHSSISNCRSKLESQGSTVLLWRLTMKSFLWLFSPFCWFKQGNCQLLVKICAQVLVYRAGISRDFVHDALLPRSRPCGSVGCASNWWSGGNGFDTPWVLQHSFWRLIMKYLLGSFFPFFWLKKGSCQFLVKECEEILVNCLED